MATEDVGEVRVKVDLDLGKLDDAAREELIRRLRGMGSDAGAGLKDSITKSVEKVGAHISGILGKESLKGIAGLVLALARGTAGLVALGSKGALSASHHMERMAESTRSASGELSRMGTLALTASRYLGTAGRAGVVAAGLMGGLTIVAAKALADFVVAAHRAAAEFDPAWKKVLTVIGDTGEGFFTLKMQVSRLAVEVGAEGKRAAEVLAEVFGAIPELIDEPTRALGLLRDATAADAAGLHKAGDTIGAVASVLDAFNLRVEDSTAVMDAFAAVQHEGQLRLSDFGKELEPAAEAMDALGGSYQDLFAILAVTTPLDIPVPEALGQLDLLLGSLRDRSEEVGAAARALGVDFSESAIQQQGFATVLTDLLAAAQGDPEVLRRIFPDPATLDLVVELAAHTDELRARIQDLGDSPGKFNEQIHEMNSSWERQKEILAGQLPGVLRDFGFEFEDWGARALAAINRVIFGLRGLDEEGRRKPRPFNVREHMDDALRTQAAREEGMNAALDARLGRAAPAQPDTAAQTTPWSPIGTIFQLRPTPPAAPTPKEVRQMVEQAGREVQEMAQQLRNAAEADLNRTRDFAAYDRAVRRANDQIRRETLRVAQRLRGNQVGEEDVDAFIAANAPDPERPKPPREDPRRAAAREELARRSAELRMEMDVLASVTRFQTGGETPFATLEDLPKKLRDAAGAVIGLRREIATLDRRIDESDQPPSPEIAAERQRLAKELREAEGTLEGLAKDPANRVADAVREARERVDGLTEGFRRLRDMGAVSLTDVPQAFTEAADRVGKLDDRIEELQAGIEAVRAAGGEPPADAEYLLTIYRQQREELARQAQALVPIQDILDELPKLGAELFEGMSPEQIRATQTALGDLAAATRWVNEAERELAAARLSQDPQRIARAEADLAAARREAAERVVGIEAELRAAGLSGEKLAEVLGIVTAELEAEGVALDAQKGKWQHFADGAKKVQASIEAVIGLGNALGILDDRSEQALKGLAEVAAGAATLATGIATQNPVAIIQGAAGLIQGGIQLGQALFGGDDKARQEQMRAMLDLRDALKSLEKTILNDMSTADVREDRDEVARAASILRNDDETYSGYGPTRRGALHDVAKAMGIADAGDDKATAIEKLKRWAAEMDEKYGTNLAGFVERSDSEGFMRALQALQTQLTREIGEMGQFGDDAAGVIERVDWEQSVAGSEDPVERLRKIVAGFEQAGVSAGEFSDELAELAQLDLSSEEGRRRRDEIVQLMTQRVLAGGADFGELTPEQVRRLIEEWAHAELPEGAADGEGGTPETRLGVNITEVQASEMLTQLATQTYYQAYLPLIYQLLSGGVPAGGLPGVGLPLSALGGHARTGPGTLRIEGFSVEVNFPAAGAAGSPPDYAAAGRLAGNALGDAFSERLSAAWRAAGGAGDPQVQVRSGGVQ